MGSHPTVPPVMLVVHAAKMQNLVYGDGVVAKLFAHLHAALTAEQRRRCDDLVVNHLVLRD